jgi:hypothetical protein
MSAPYRLRRPDVGVRKVSRGSGEELKQYLDRLMRVIPGEVVGLYLIGSGFVPEGQTAGHIAWFAFCFAALIVIRVFGNADPARNQRAQPVPIVLSVVAFVIWVYTIGGPFRELGMDVPWIGSLLVLAWSFVIPYFYKGEAEG